MVPRGCPGPQALSARKRTEPVMLGAGDVACWQCRVDAGCQQQNHQSVAEQFCPYPTEGGGTHIHQADPPSNLFRVKNSTGLFCFKHTTDIAGESI